MDACLAVFAYSFPHKKTADFLLMLKAHGYKNVCVIGAPKVALKQSADPIYSIPQAKIDLSTEQLCGHLGFAFKEIKHDNVLEISDFLKANGAPRLAVISGARIIKGGVIELFPDGVVNFHPGSIPETSGLDSFYWMMKNQSLPGTTVHLIDERVDAGQLIFFHELEIDKRDDLVTLKHRLYQNQLAAFERWLKVYSTCQNLMTSVINRPSKNKPMSLADKEEVLASAQHWFNWVVEQQSAFKSCFSAIESGDIEEFMSSFEPGFQFRKNAHGRTLLAESAFHHRYDIAEFLIENDADINAINTKGTTVIMYAKSRLMDGKSDQAGLDFITYLKTMGADTSILDCFGKSVLDYIPKSCVELIERIEA